MSKADIDRLKKLKSDGKQMQSELNKIRHEIRKIELENEISRLEKKYVGKYFKKTPHSKMKGITYYHCLKVDKYGKVKANEFGDLWFGNSYRKNANFYGEYADIEQITKKEYERAKADFLTSLKNMN
jgi:hypothetical protein